MSVAEYVVDYSEVAGKKAECIEGCGMCCLCQPEVLPSERAYFKENHPRDLVRTKGPEPYTALALKKGCGSCVFLNGDRRCRVYGHRTTYCRQYPYHLYASDRVQVELDLSCRGLWTGRGASALDEAKAVVAAASDRLSEAVKDASAVYEEFYANARAAGVMADSSMLRMSVSEHLDDFTDLGFISQILALSDSDSEMSISGALRGAAYDINDLNDAARAAAMESLSSEDPVNLPVYCGEDLSWNIFSAAESEIVWHVLDGDGNLERKGSAPPQSIRINVPNDEGRKVLADYIRVLNGRDSFLGSVYWLIDADGYADDMANAYYGSMATAVLDILWRTALLDRFFGTGFGARGIRDAVIFYDMDRLDAPAIGAFV
ncbi:YkgJ family cysteine cluster protein [Candidatus Methanomethylophilus sp. 1R26]|uniref:YkgJ family cysteine cluster protein n=1 Tax=Candidatus Methanomethylophilus sp. 1R26 TaxID=1769296 RepID=UPI001F39975E|nr:YkgJ family cysteine cluster protein [Candidatus Methanomethylophilus sp. 1R26]